MVQVSRSYCSYVTSALQEREDFSSLCRKLKITCQLRKVLQRVQEVLAKVNFSKGHG